MEQAKEITRKLEDMAKQHETEYDRVQREYMTIALYLFGQSYYQQQDNMKRIPMVALRIAEENIQAQKNKNRSTQEKNGKNNYQKKQ